MDNKKITYREIKSTQQADMHSNRINVNIYRYISPIFTYFLLKLKISPNTITISNFFLCLIGFYFLSRGTYAQLTLGLLFFILFRILDMSDGEVARMQKSSSIEGVYYDRISHYIYSLTLGLGLGFGMFKLYQNEIYLFLGFLFTFVFILEWAIGDLIKSLIRENIIKLNIKKHSGNVKDLGKYIYKKLMYNVQGRSWNKGNIFSKLLGVYPFQGLIYTDYHVPPILLGLTIIEYFQASLSGIPTVFSYAFGIISLYILIVSISKLIWIIIFIYKIEKNRHITVTLKKM